MGGLFSPEKFIQIATAYAPYFKQGAIYTVTLALAAIGLGFVFALVITSLRMCRVALLRWVALAYIEVIRGTPILVQLMIIYYGVATVLPVPAVNLFGFIQTSMFIPGAIAVACNSAAYISEIIRGGILAVDSGQNEAARSLGMTPLQSMVEIVLPQAVKNILPALGNEFVIIIKESSVCMVIGIPELMYNTNIAKGATFRTMEPLVMAAILYFMMTFVISKLIAHFERRMRRGDRV